MAEVLPKKYSFIGVPFIGFLLAFGITLYSKDLPFFWDAIMTGSKAAHHFYEKGLGNLILPEKIDAGHPPLFGIYLACIWKLAGRTLGASHFSMLPFSFLAIWSIWLLVKKGTDSLSLQIAILIAVILEPGFLALLTQSAYDLPLLAFFLAALAAINYRQNSLLTFSLLPLGLLSSRGFLLFLVLAVVQLFQNRKSLLNPSLKNIAITLGPFLPAGLLWATWQLWHLHQTGWMAYNPDSQWAVNYQKAKGIEILRNAGLIVWRCLDFGRITLWILLAGILYKYGIKKQVLPIQTKFLLLSGTLAIAIPGLLLLWYHNPISHRYFQAAYSCGIMATLLALHNLNTKTQVLACFAVIISGLAGALIPYPDKVARGWDATPLWVVYPKVFESSDSIIINRRIKQSELGSEFPNLDSKKFTYLSQDSESDTLQILDLGRHKYAWYSNVFNDLSDSTVDALKSWKVIYEKEELGVKMKLLENPAK